MSILEREVKLGISAERAWGVLADFKNVHAFAPGIKSSPLLSEQNRDIGACRRCHFSVGGMSMVETVTAWEEGRSLTIELSEFPMPFHRGDMTMTITPTSGSQCSARVLFQYNMKYGFAGAILNVTMIRPMMAMQLGKLLKNIEKQAKESPVVATLNES